MSKLYITLDQKLKLAKYLVEHRYVTIKEDGTFAYRVKQPETLKDLKDEFDFKVGPQQIITSMEYYFTYMRHKEEKIVIPPPLESVNETVLKIELSKREITIKELEEKIKTMELVTKGYNNYEKDMSEIFKIVNKKRLAL